MKVTLRKKKGVKTSLYLDIYNNGKRKFEYLKLYLYNKPKTPIEKNHNRETLILAENIAAQRQLQLQNDHYGFNKTENGNLSFLSYFEAQMEKRADSQGNYGNWKSTLNYLKIFSKGDILFSQVSPSFLERFKTYLLKEVKNKKGKNLSQNSSLSYFNKVRATINQAHREGIIQSNPVKAVKGIKEREVEIEFLTEKEIKKLKNTEFEIPVLKNAFLFSCYTGLRFSDVKKLKWGNVHFSPENDQHYIRYRQKKTDRPETLPIPDIALEFCGEKLQADELVFTDLKYSDHNNKKLRLWMQKAGIPKHITFHSSRHTNAILHLTKGTDIYTVSKLLGHKNIKTTERYAKVVDSMKTYAIKKLDL